MKKILFGLIIIYITLTSAIAQVANICTYPVKYSFDHEVTWYFDLTGNSKVSPGDTLFFWSWQPKNLPGGNQPMKYVGNMTWSLTCIPTQLYGVTLADLQAAGNTAFWSCLYNKKNVNVTGTIPFAQKELMRLGNQCYCVGEMTSKDNTFYLNLGNSVVSSPDMHGLNWTNLSLTNQINRLVDTLGIYRYDVIASGNFKTNNISGLTTPNSNLLGNMAVKEATESYFYLNTGKGNITIKCLNPLHLYRLSIFGSYQSANIKSSKYTITGSETKSSILQTSGKGISSDGTMNLNDKNLYVAEVFPDGTGNIDLQVEVANGDSAFINVMKIEEIVNPSTVAITSLKINTDQLSTSGPSTLKIDFLPVNTTQKSVTWSIDNSSIALIDLNGNLRPLKKGTVKVVATSIFNPSIGDTVDITFDNLYTNFYLTGTASEAISINATDALPMRRVYDADSTVTGIFEIYTSVKNSGSLFFYSANDASGKLYGANNSGKILPSDNSVITGTSGGWKYITVNLNNNTYTITNITGWNIISNMLPKLAGQETWWGGTASLPNYEGRGVWSGTIDFSVYTTADNNPRFYIEQINTGRIIKQINKTKNKLIFTDATGANLYSDINQFNGIYKVSLDMQNFTFSVTKNCNPIDPTKISVFGSSVSKGYGAVITSDNTSLYNGYAHQYDLLLHERFVNGQEKNWHISNLGVGGNNTIDALNRLDQHLYTDCGKYVIFGLSLGNEGILTGGQAEYNQFRDNMLALIDSAKKHNIIPVVVNNYPNSYYNATHYNYIKQINLLMHEWDLPSVNILGAIDNGAGQWVTGYYKDNAHPNQAGYVEIFHSFVPSLFDAIAAGKAQPKKVTGTYITMGTNSKSGMLTLVPEDTIHSYTMSFDFKTSGIGTLASVISGNNRLYINIDSSTGVVKYISSNGQIKSTGAVNDGQWHKVSLTHYYAWGISKLYLDGVLCGNVIEKTLVDSLMLSDISHAPASIDYRDWFFYRSGMNASEMTALNNGTLLKSSLEIYAPLDGQSVLGNNILINLAQSTNKIGQVFEDIWSGITTNQNLFNNSNEITIYPTITNDFLTIKIISPVINVKDFKIYNMQGQLLMQNNIAETETKINVKALSKGIYQIRIGNTNKRFIKE